LVWTEVLLVELFERELHAELAPPVVLTTTEYVIGVTRRPLAVGSSMQGVAARGVVYPGPSSSPSLSPCS
jgi:hypothetical protein